MNVPARYCTGYLGDISVRLIQSKLGALSSVGDGLGTARQAPVHVPEGARFEERTFSNDVGSRTYKVYMPSGYTGQSLPVVGHRQVND